MRRQVLKCAFILLVAVISIGWVASYFGATGWQYSYFIAGETRAVSIFRTHTETFGVLVGGREGELSIGVGMPVSVPFWRSSSTYRQLGPFRYSSLGTPQRMTVVEIPFWFPLIMLGGGVYAVRLLAWRIRQVRRIRGLCDNCCYDLSANISGICPECGTDCDYALWMPQQAEDS